ncbi:MAG: IPTL-CTERM sorting domain-containing protein [Brevundimonas sp.]|uniref:IPTL-CTERM sorting domain-containing protein n=1 Tax=Brevundimonas sp. TaxID=1871086 RepID=UPI0025C204EE|nr:IPTL-CTERM sorting domain-containing protein [Brevundimonas sp.]MBX3477442.1 IPTL-CTERM sorting domain-containing protein [Brevundimonas sp.]
MTIHWLAAAAATAVISLAGPAAAQAVYSVQSGTYSTVNDMGGVCTVGPCSPYSLADRVQGVFTVPAPFAPNLTNYDFGPDLLAFDIDDGAVIYDSTDPRARIANAVISTDGAGNITGYRLVLQVLHGTGATYPVNNFADVEARFSYFLYEGGFAAAGRNNYVCLDRRGDSAASGPGTCGSSNGGPDSDIDNSSRFTGGGAPTTPVLVSYAPPVAVVPTMTEWAMILFGLLLAGGAAMHLQRRRTV